MERQPLIEFRNVIKRFGERTILNGVNFKIYEGEVTTIIGLSGTGKSVLLKTTNGLLTPDAGDVRIGGFGPLFSGILLLSLLPLAAAFTRPQAPRLLLALGAVTIVASLLVSVHTWWPRYGPQLFPSLEFEKGNQAAVASTGRAGKLLAEPAFVVGCALLEEGPLDPPAT